VQLGSALHRSAAGIGNGNSYTLTNESKDNIERLRVDTMQRQHDCDNDRSVLEIAQLINEAATLNGSTTR
jgi:hypothetical protein